MFLRCLRPDGQARTLVLIAHARIYALRTHSGVKYVIFQFTEDHHACWFAAINTDVQTAVDISIPDLQA